MPTKLITVYKIVNTVNGKIYVGQTTDMARRMREHTRGKNPNAAIHGAIAKHGKENFTHEVICVCANKTVADAIEIALIKLWGTIEVGYNLAPGGRGTGVGEANHRYGKPTSEKQKQAAANSNRRRAGCQLTDEHKKKVSEAMKNRIFTEEHRKKLSAAQTGTRNHRYGTKAMPELRAKLSAARKGKPKPEGFAEAQRQRMKEVWAKRKAEKLGANT